MLKDTQDIRKYVDLCLNEFLEEIHINQELNYKSILKIVLKYAISTG